MIHRLSGILAMASLTSFLFSGTIAPVTCTPVHHDDHTGAIVGGIAGGALIGTLILVEVHKDHHRIKGCVSMGANGLELQDPADLKMYALTGVTAQVKVGDLIQLHGTKEKQVKGSTGERTFAIEKMSRDYGPCKVIARTMASVERPVRTPEALPIWNTLQPRWANAAQ